MSTQEIISQVRSLSLSERMALMEAILKSVKAEIEEPEVKRKAVEERKNGKNSTGDIGGPKSKGFI
jgi:hypothetical protein